MTVAELIAELEKWPKDARVEVIDEPRGYVAAKSITKSCMQDNAIVIEG